MKKTILVTIAFTIWISICSVALVSCEDEEPAPPPAEQPAATPVKQTDTVQFTNPPVDSSSKTVTPAATDTIKKPAATSAKKPAATPSQPAAAAKKPDADIEAGKQLLTSSGCLTCHKQAEKLVGPAYTEVAKKYADSEANIELLAGKIIKGGNGVWGPVPMTPHPALGEEDAKKMVKYILSLDAE